MEQRNLIVVFLLFLWAISGVPSFLVFYSKEELFYLELVKAIEIPRYYVSAASIFGNLCLFAALIVQAIELLRRRYKNIWVCSLLVGVMAVNYYHWHIIGKIVST